MISIAEVVQHSDSPKRELCCASGTISPTVVRGNNLIFTFLNLFYYFIVMTVLFLTIIKILKMVIM